MAIVSNFVQIYRVDLLYADWKEILAGVFTCILRRSVCNVYKFGSMFVAAGPSLIARFRPDLLENFTDYCDYQSVADYIYHCNAQKPRCAIS